MLSIKPESAYKLRKSGQAHDLPPGMPPVLRPAPCMGSELPGGPVGHAFQQPCPHTALCRLLRGPVRDGGHLVPPRKADRDQRCGQRRRSFAQDAAAHPDAGPFLTIS
jgi:hypothetical protein